MRFAVALAALVLSATAGCGSEEPEPSTAPPPLVEPSVAAGGGGPVDPAEPQVLTAVVGEQDDPNAFVITLEDAAGQEVTSLPAGEYEVLVTDHSRIHNFHLSGPAVDESTTVPEEVETRWTVTLEEGEHLYQCDPHPSMVGSFTVT